jgi:UrcA family protein
MLASAPLAMVANGARAGEPVEAPRHMVVSFTDLNLSSTEGAAVLYGRIKHAAQEVCGDRDGSRLSRSHLTLTCVNQAVSRAVAQVNNPILTGLYNVKTAKADKQEPTLARAR